MTDSPFMRRIAPPVRTHAPLHEDVLWTLERDGHTREARLAQQPHGAEIRIYFDGKFRASTIVRDGVAGMVIAMKAEWLEKGWKENTR